MIYLSGIKDCDCPRGKGKVITTQKITNDLTFLICLNCGGKVGQHNIKE